MSNFEDTIDDIENRFLASPEDSSFIVGIKMELDILIEQTHDVISRGRLNTSKKHSEKTI